MTPASVSDALNLMPGRERIIAIIGAGGKTTLMFRLAIELADKGLRVAVTTTTKIFRPEGTPVLGSDEFENPLTASAVKPGSYVVVGNTCMDDTRKLSGIEPDMPRRWLNRNLCDVVLVEADGSRGLPLKAPKAGEPVYPGGCDLVLGVTGWDGISAPAGPDVIQHWPEFLKVTGQFPGEPMTDFSMARLLNSPRGLYGQCPDDVRCCWIINKADTLEDWLTARDMCQFIMSYCARLDRTVVTSLNKRFAPVDCILSPLPAALETPRPGADTSP